MTPHYAATKPTSRLRTFTPLVIVLLCVWLTLWRQFDVISIVTGIVFSVLVVGMFQLPNVQLIERVHPLWLIVLAGRVIGWVVLSSLEVAWLTVRPQPKPKASIIAYRMRARSDWLLTLAALINMFVPGSVVVDVDRTRGIIYLHQFAAEGPDGIAAARRAAYRIEDAIALAFASHEDLHHINRWRAEHEYPPLWASRRQRVFEAAVERDRLRHETEWEEQS